MSADLPRFRDYHLVLREVTPGEFIIVSFNRIGFGNLPASNPLRAKEILIRKNPVKAPPTPPCPHTTTHIDPDSFIYDHRVCDKCGMIVQSE